MEKQLAQLDEVLTRQIAAHERLLVVMKQKLAAFRAADPEQMASCCRRENEALQAIGELEKQRLTCVAELTRLVDPAAAAPLRMGELAEQLSEPARAKLLVLRSRLIERMEQVKREGSIARRAAEVLVRHMQGLVQTIGGAITGVATYSKKGAPPPMAMALSTFSATA